MSNGIKINSDNDICFEVSDNTLTITSNYISSSNFIGNITDGVYRNIDYVTGGTVILDKLYNKIVVSASNSTNIYFPNPILFNNYEFFIKRMDNSNNTVTLIPKYGIYKDSALTGSNQSIDAAINAAGNKILFSGANLSTQIISSSTPNLKLLLHMENISGTNVFVDSSPYKRKGLYPQQYPTDLEINNEQYKFGSSSLKAFRGGVYFDEYGDISFTTGDFTLEFWMYPLSTNSFTNGGYIFSTLDPLQGSNPGTHLQANKPVISLAYGRLYWTGYSAPTISSSVVNINEWHHVAFSRTGSILNMFIDGNLINSASSTNDYNFSSIYVGGNQNAPSFNGYIDDFRIIKNICLYTASFSPPTESFSNNELFLTNNTITNPTGTYVYLYKKVSNNWIIENVFSSSYTASWHIATSENFGYSVDINSLGNKVFIGAHGDYKTVGGSVYVYNSSSNGWSLETILTSDSASNFNDKFGYIVKCNSEGDKIFISAINDDYSNTYNYNDPNYINDKCGTVYVFSSSSIGWVQENIIKIDLRKGYSFGLSIDTDISGSKLLVGRNESFYGTPAYGAAYLFNSESASWTLTKIFGEPIQYSYHYGKRVKISHDGSTIANLADPYWNQGRVYVYKYVNSSWVNEFTYSFNKGHGLPQVYLDFDNNNRLYINNVDNNYIYSSSSFGWNLYNSFTSDTGSNMVVNYSGTNVIYNTLATNRLSVYNLDFSVYDYLSSSSDIVSNNIVLSSGTGSYNYISNGAGWYKIG